MKWIGQHIYDLIARFRDDVYLEDISTGTIASGGNLGLDSNNKIVKATISSTTDLTSDVTGVLPASNGGTGTSSYVDNQVVAYNAGTGKLEGHNVFIELPTTNVHKLKIGDSSSTSAILGSENGAPLSISVDLATGANAAGSDLTLTAGLSTGTAAGGNIIFKSSSTGSSGSIPNTNSELARITGAGNVGIGTTSPDSLLQISSSSATDFLKLTSGSGSATPVKLIFEKSGSEQGIIEYNRNGDLEIYNTDGDGGVMIDGSASAGGDLYVNHAGNVGIGTTAPEEKLSVSGSIQLTNQQDLTWADIGDGNAGRVAIRGNEDDDWIMFKTDNSERMRLTNTGLGIGTTSPASKLHVDGDVQVGVDDTGYDVKFFGATSGASFLYDQSGDQVTITGPTTAAQLELFTISSGVPTVPQIKIGRDSSQYYGALVGDREARVMHRQDETSGTMHTYFEQWDSNTSDDTGTWKWRAGDGDGNSMATVMTLTQAGDITTTGNISIGDSNQLKIGTGDDLQIHHDGSNSYIDQTGTGNLYIRNTQEDGLIYMQSNYNGSVSSFFYLHGAYSSSNPYTIFPNNSIAAFGNSADLRIYHDGSNSYLLNNTGNLDIRQTTDDGDIIFRCDDGSGGNVEYIRIDGSVTRTIFSKQARFSDSVQLTLGDGGDLELVHDGSVSSINNYTGNFFINQHADDGDIIFQSDDGSGGTTTYLTVDGSAEQTRFFKDTRHTDGIKANFGNSDDLQIYHDGSNSYIVDAGTGDLLNYFSNEWKVIKYGSSETCIEATSDGSVDLYYDNSKKLETTSTGVEVTGNIALTGSVQKQIQVFPMNFVDDLGTDKHFMPFVTNTEQTVNYQEEAAMVMPADGRVVSVTVHYAQMHGTDGNITVGIETSPCGQSYTNAWTVEETETIAASVTDDHHVFHFAFDNAKHFESTEKMAISIQQSTAMQNASRFFWVTAVVEYDWSTFLGGTSAEHTTTP